jgi:hypothetical protein
VIFASRTDDLMSKRGQPNLVPQTDRLAARSGAQTKVPSDRAERASPFNSGFIFGCTSFDFRRATSGKISVWRLLCRSGCGVTRESSDLSWRSSPMSHIINQDADKRRRGIAMFSL